MQIQFPTNIATPVAARLAAALPWSVNDILVAKVVGKTEENFTRLAIGDRIVVARTDAMLEIGQKLNLKVTATGDTTVMKVLQNDTPVAANTVTRALARVLPQQALPQDTEKLLRTLDVLRQDPQGLSAAVGRSAAAKLGEDIQNLRIALPKAEQLQTAPQLRSAVEQAALPTEARLQNALASAAAPDISADARAQFARLAADLDALPTATRGELDKFVQQRLHTHGSAHVEIVASAQEQPQPAATALTGEHHGTDLKTLVESVAARLEANQLQNAGTSPSAQQPLLIDLPIARAQYTDMLHMEVESDAHQGSGDAAPRTSVTLNLKLDGGHEFSARLQLSGDSLSLRLGSTDAGFNDQIAAQIGDLEHDLADAGLLVNQIFIAPLTISNRPRIGARQLINERV